MESVRTSQKEFAFEAQGFCPNLLLSLDFVLCSCKYRHVGDKQDPDTVPFCKDFQSDRYYSSCFMQ